MQGGWTEWHTAWTQYLSLVPKHQNRWFWPSVTPLYAAATRVGKTPHLRPCLSGEVLVIVPSERATTIWPRRIMPAGLGVIPVFVIRTVAAVLPEPSSPWAKLSLCELEIFTLRGMANCSYAGYTPRLQLGWVAFRSQPLLQILNPQVHPVSSCQFIGAFARSVKVLTVLARDRDLLGKSFLDHCGI